MSLTTNTQSLGHPSQLIPTTPGKHSHCPSSCLQLAPTANSVLAVKETETEKEDVQPIQEEIANQIRKKMKKMKMNRDLEHIEVIFDTKKTQTSLKKFSYVNYLNR